MAQTEESTDRQEKRRKQAEEEKEQGRLSDKTEVKTNKEKMEI